MFELESRTSDWLPPFMMTILSYHLISPDYILYSLNLTASYRGIAKNSNISHFTLVRQAPVPGPSSNVEVNRSYLVKRRNKDYHTGLASGLFILETSLKTIFLPFLLESASGLIQRSRRIKEKHHQDFHQKIFIIKVQGTQYFIKED